MTNIWYSHAIVNETSKYSRLDNIIQVFQSGWTSIKPSSLTAPVDKVTFYFQAEHYDLAISDPIPLIELTVVRAPIVIKLMQRI
jgi:hypothetical protein